MTITAPQLLSEIQTDLLEIANDGSSWGTERWTTTEVYNHLRRRFQQFLKDTQAYTYLETEATIPNVNRVDLAQTWITGIRVAWRALNYTISTPNPPLPGTLFHFTGPTDPLTWQFTSWGDPDPTSFSEDGYVFIFDPDYPDDGVGNFSPTEFSFTTQDWDDPFVPGHPSGIHIDGYTYTPESVTDIDISTPNQILMRRSVTDAGADYVQLAVGYSYLDPDLGHIFEATETWVYQGSESSNLSRWCTAIFAEAEPIPVPPTWTEAPQYMVTFTEIPRVDSWEVDHDDPTSNYTMAHPKKYTEAELPPPQLNLWPAPDVPGQLELHSISMPTNFDPTSSTFAPLPDELVTYLKYGVIADMLSKQGRGLDMARAQYCESRYQEGVELVKMILTGGP